MKKMLVISLAIMILPIFALAGAFKVPTAKHLSFSGDFGRGYRQSQRVYNNFFNDTWQPESRTIPTYSGQYPSRVVSLRMDSWDEGAWTEGVMNTQISYNAQGRATQIVSYYNFMNLQFPGMKIISEYDSQSRLIHSYMFRGDMQSMDTWIPMSRMHLIYAAGTAFEVYTWQDEPNEMAKNIYYTHSVLSFDTRGRMTEDISYTSPDSLNWVLDGKTTFAYHPQDQSTGSDLIETLASQYTLLFMDEGDFLPGKITAQYRYDRVNEQWLAMDYDTWEYDNNLRLQTHLSSFFDTETNAWKPSSRDEYTYDTNGLLSYMISKWHNGTDFENSSKTDYSWEQYTSNSDLVAPLPRLDFSAHPNPFADMLSVAADTAKNAPLNMEVYNLRGQKLYQTTANNKEIEWNGMDFYGNKLPAGVYFVRLSQDGVSATKRVLKLK